MYCKEDGVQETFRRVFHHLRQDGLFLFDVHSLYKIHHVFQNETYTVNGKKYLLFGIASLVKNQIV